MISSVLGSVVSRLIVGGSLESLELSKAGINIEEEMEGRIIHLIQAKDIMTGDVETIPEGMTLRKLIEYIPQSHYTTFPLVDEKGNLTGIISIQDFRGWIFEE
ncbi:MAG TPA: CBS domain-containing protein [Thermodesulfobacteriota bacterium]|nr:CBS domain-containing protein [Thermodesulfobacteriota bacterium]